MQLTPAAPPPFLARLGALMVPRAAEPSPAAQVEEAPVPSVSSAASAASAAAATPPSAPADDASLATTLLVKVGDAQARSIGNQQLVGAVTAMLGARLSSVGANLVATLRGLGGDGAR